MLAALQPARNRHVMATQDPSPATLDGRIDAARSWSVALGALGLVASVLQMLGVVEAGVPGWVNLLIAASTVALGLALVRKSLAVTAALLAIFIAILADTLIATGFVFERGGTALTIVLVLRYIVLLNAARAIGQVFVEILRSRRAARNRGALDAPAPAAAIGESPDAPARAAAGLAPATSPSAILFGGLAAFLLAGAGNCRRGHNCRRGQVFFLA